MDRIFSTMNMDQVFELLRYIPMWFAMMAIAPENYPDNRYAQALGAWGYRVQSRVLRVRSTWGYFSPGPARVQGYEGASFAQAVLTSIPPMIIVLVRRDSFPPGFPWVLGCIIPCTYFLSWVTVLRDRHKYLSGPQPPQGPGNAPAN